ncbi:MAG: hypothetical protein KDE15_07860 [Erythrobacter sp.]|nr:hypothetical protein [Erythrobacter sp.]
MEHQPFTRHREAALALLHRATGLSRKAGGFLGQCVVDPSPMTPKQAAWMANLLVQEGLPPLADEQVQ